MMNNASKTVHAAHVVNTLRPKGGHFTDDILKCIFFNLNV